MISLKVSGGAIKICDSPSEVLACNLNSFETYMMLSGGIGEGIQGFLQSIEKLSLYIANDKKDLAQKQLVSMYQLASFADKKFSFKCFALGFLCKSSKEITNAGAEANANIIRTATAEDVDSVCEHVKKNFNLN